MDRATLTPYYLFIVELIAVWFVFRTNSGPPNEGEGFREYQLNASCFTRHLMPSFPTESNKEDIISPI